ncbi:MAG TPA: DUF2934 domain-containing protein [Terriglobales bacterium]|jgi:Protein of unknown function (DUF2934)|nr:DUF2934 domain-containing protein [Terriglobales bacterium]
MSTDATKKSPTAVTTKPQEPELELELQIRLRAYELYEARGKEDGHDRDDWLRAEEEIKKKKKVRTAAA